MLKDIFTKIEKKIFDFSQDEKRVINSYIKDEIIIKVGEDFEINSKYKIGILKIDKNFAILEDLLNPIKNIKIELDYLNGAFNNDLVLAKRVFNPRSKIKAKVTKVLDGKKAEILVYVEDSSFFTLKENIELASKNTKTYKNGDVLIIDNKEFKEIKFIGNLDEPKIDEFISLYIYEELYRDEQKIEVDEFIEDENQRVDLRELPFCTIDPNSAKDHDDAIYFDEKDSTLFVAIADVSYFVKEGSSLDTLAYKKSSTIYLPTRTLPMLPSILSENLCSLKEGIDRYAYVFKLKLDLKNLKVKSSELFTAIIKNHRNFSYGRIDRVLENNFDQYNENEKRIFDYLLPLYEVTKKLRKDRLKKGYDFRSQENRLKLKNQLLQSVEIEKSTASHQLIEECMLLANIEASKKVGTLGIFRVHEEPNFKALSKLIDDVNILGVKAKIKDDVHQTIAHIQEEADKLLLREEIDELIIQSLTQAKYSSKNLGHFGLGFKSYSHFTSPIRRYSDLILHRILKSKKLPKEIDDICTHISEQERNIDKLVWDFEDRTYARWAKDNIGNEIRVKIVDVERAKAVCIDKMFGLKVVIENYKGQKLFSKHKVKIVSSNLATKIIVAKIL
ncbi:ribonuclease R [Aliarcobacter trophiarum LMG 25534]|uniref:Ribonuclease R n=1 Tax=Aliarcobacter trophiarum LMG 25534 TaxID=1032241 RepID=A0AAD0QLQ4_9BACT|nr:ribonuclease R family protein [Aliarcobacter trophiarum]AXK49596.1 ribonuclease R [Aliarcobacter trophiarum LMG 25534]RXJ92269.1 ribonuclease R [Aliarcobacter trophiarum LMG 25534]